MEEPKEVTIITLITNKHKKLGPFKIDGSALCRAEVYYYYYFSLSHLGIRNFFLSLLLKIRTIHAGQQEQHE